jgi:hypothetical protein
MQTHYDLICQAWNSLSSSENITAKMISERIQTMNRRNVSRSQIQKILKTICLSGFGNFKTISGKEFAGPGAKKISLQ